MNILPFHKIFYSLQLFFSKWSIVIPLAVWAIWVQTVYRVPSEFIFIVIPWIGVGLTILAIIHLTNIFLSKSDEKDQAHSIIQNIAWVGNLALLVFIAYGVVVFVNGQGNRGTVVKHKSEIRTIADVPDDFLRYVPYAWFELQSWEDPQKTVRIFWEPDVDDRLYPGQPVLVHLQKGLLGIHWVKEVVADKEAHARRVLEISPTASGALEELVDYYMDTGQWDKALNTAQHYMALFPQDMDSANGWAVAFNVARQSDKTLALVEPYINSPGGYRLANHYGWHLGQNRTPDDTERAVAVLKAAMSREPNRWEAPYSLGFVLSWNGRPKEALEAFEYMQTLRRGSPDVISEMAKLKKQLSSESPSKPKT